ncbi:MAG TPA: hypothetical protein VM056_07525 [Terriglobales bacterium]|nr:hypothetical protein [Terriglobales bacterium]
MQNRYFAGLVAVAFVVCPLSLADVKVKSRMTVAGNSMETSSYIKGARQRQEMAAAPGYTMITIIQCDLNRMVQLNERTKMYMITLLNDAPATTPSSDAGLSTTRSSRPSRHGGTVTFTTNVQDTGQRKQIFGYTARQIKTQMSTEASPDSCSGAQDMKMSSDGWYIDFPGVNLGCADGGRAAVRMRPEKPECTDKTQFRTTGTAKLGFPVTMETTVTGAGGQPMTMKQETVDLQTATLDPALFEIPPGYREAKSQAELMGMPDMAAIMRGARDEESSPRTESRSSSPARSGIRKGLLKVGLVKFGPAAEPESAEVVRLQLANSITELEVDAVLLEATATTPREQVEAEAKSKGCQYFVYNEMATNPNTTKEGKPTKKAFGGMFGKVLTGADAATVAAESLPSFNYKLYETGDEKIRKEAAAKAVMAGSTANDALQVEAAEVVVQIRKDYEERRRGLKVGSR